MRSRGVLCCFLLFCSFHDAHAECGLDARARIDGEKKESVCKEAVKALQTVFQHKTPDKVGDSAALEMVCPIMQMEALADDSSGQCLHPLAVLILDGTFGDTAVPTDEALQHQPCRGQVQIFSPAFEGGRRPKFQPQETPAPLGQGKERVHIRNAFAAALRHQDTAPRSKSSASKSSRTSDRAVSLLSPRRFTVQTSSP